MSRLDWLLQWPPMFNYWSAFAIAFPPSKYLATNWTTRSGLVLMGSERRLLGRVDGGLRLASWGKNPNNLSPGSLAPTPGVMLAPWTAGAPSGRSHALWRVHSRRWHRHRLLSLWKQWRGPTSSPPWRRWGTTSVRRISSLWTSRWRASRARRGESPSSSTGTTLGTSRSRTRRRSSPSFSSAFVHFAGTRRSFPSLLTRELLFSAFSALDSYYDCTGHWKSELQSSVEPICSELFLKYSSLSTTMKVYFLKSLLFNVLSWNQAYMRTHFYDQRQTCAWLG